LCGLTARLYHPARHRAEWTESTMKPIRLSLIPDKLFLNAFGLDELHAFTVTFLFDSFSSEPVSSDDTVFVDRRRLVDSQLLSVLYAGALVASPVYAVKTEPCTRSRQSCEKYSVSS